MTLRIVLLVAVLAAVLTVAGWLYRREDVDAPPSTDAPRGYYLNQARITQTNPDGGIRYALDAQRIEQNLQTDRIDLQTLALQFHTQHDNRWQLSARTGWLNNRTQQAAFAGEVRIQPGSSASTFLLTNTLNVDLAAQTAHTTAPVTLRMNAQTVTAKGLHADIKTQKLKLESQVHGAFELSKPLGSAVSR